MSPTTRVLVLDSDGENLPAALDGLEEMLGILDHWEREDGPLTLPEPIAGGVALGALERVRQTLAASQGEQAKAAGLTGRISRQLTRPWMGLDPGHAVEVAPLRVLSLDTGDVAVLVKLAALLLDRSGPGMSTVDYAAEQAADQTRPTWGPARTGEDIYRAAEQLAQLLSVEWDNDVHGLADMLAALPPDQDVELTTDQSSAYGLAVVLIVQATGGNRLDLFTVGY